MRTFCEECMCDTDWWMIWATPRFHVLRKASATLLICVVCTVACRLPAATHIRTDEASHACSRSDDYSSAFLWFSAPPPDRLWTKLNILVCCCCSSWPGLPEPPSLRSRSKQHSQSFRALPASKTSSVRTGDASVRIFTDISGTRYTLLVYTFAFKTTFQVLIT